MSGADPDELDRHLITELAADPRRSYADLGKRLGTSGTTVSARLDRLRSTGVITFKAAPNLAAFGLTTEIIGNVEADVGQTAETIRVLETSPNVLRIDQIAGEFNLHFTAAFPNDSAVADFLRKVRATPGVRRVAVEHVVENVKQSDGWSAAFATTAPGEPRTYEVAAGTRVPSHLEPFLDTVAKWAYAYVAGDLERLRDVSDPHLVLEIIRPQSHAGTFEGLEAVAFAGHKIRELYRRWWYRIVAVNEAAPPFTLVVDAMSPAERDDGRVTTIFSRNAFAIEGEKVVRVTGFGAVPLEDPAVELPPEAQPTR